MLGNPQGGHDPFPARPSVVDDFPRKPRRVAPHSLLDLPGEGVQLTGAFDGGLSSFVLAGFEMQFRQEAAGKEGLFLLRHFFQGPGRTAQDRPRANWRRGPGEKRWALGEGLVPQVTKNARRRA